MLLHVFEASPGRYSIKTKFNYLKTIIDNVFLNNETKEEFLNLFSKSQRNYWIIKKCIQKHKWRKTAFQIKSDLILNSISETQHNVITILQNNKKYLFTVMDLKNIIECALCNSPYMFSEPTPPKNPYNNLPFDKSILYTIYFFMKHGHFVLSTLFHNFFLCDFNLTKFKMENEVIIRKKYIQQFIKNREITELYFDGIRMLKSSKFTKKLRIAYDFPKKTFVSIMLPYLKIYYCCIYSLDLCERNNSACELNMQLNRFYNYNPQFGRKYIEFCDSKPNIITFNVSHVKFKVNDHLSNNNYLNTHLELYNISLGNDSVLNIHSNNMNDLVELGGVSDEESSEDSESNN